MHAKLFSLWFYFVSCLFDAKVKRVERKFPAKRIEFRFAFAMMTVDGLSNGLTFIYSDCIWSVQNYCLFPGFALLSHSISDALSHPRTNETKRRKRQKKRICFGKGKIKEKNKLSFVLYWSVLDYFFKTLCRHDSTLSPFLPPSSQPHYIISYFGLSWLYSDSESRHIIKESWS